MVDVQIVRNALEYLYANAELANSELAAEFPGIQVLPDTIDRAQALRGLLLDAIESLRPLKPAPPHVLTARSHQVLSLRYISGLSVEEIAEELSVGERQVYRDLRRSEEELLAVLLSRSERDARPASPAAANAIQAELAVLDKAHHVADVAELLAGAIETVELLADQLGVHIQYDGPTRGLRAIVLPGVTRQVLVQLLSAAIQTAEQPVLRIEFRADEDAARLLLFPVHRPEDAPRSSVLKTALSLADSSGHPCELVEAPTGAPAVQLTLRLQSQSPVVIVEDNPSTRQLYERYLENSGWQPIPAPDPRAAVDMAATVATAAVIIDLLMPEVDGWAMLQTLKLDPRTAAIPVVVCSVVSDDELARALGAAASLKKPVSRNELLQTLHRVARPHNVV
jgi:CheY-like chemotaxis protein/DNA-binding CsgD family transcriptional regulator